MIGIGYVWVSGILRGGDFRLSLWQLDRVVYLPIVFLLFQKALRGPKDHSALARVVLTAATYKAVLAVYIINTVTVPADPETGSTRLPYATSHHDSMLFATAFVLLLALVVERAGRRGRRLALMLLPVLIAGMIANGRRMAWVQIAVVCVTGYLIAPDNSMKRKLRKSAVFATPLFLGYVLVGWNSGSSLFKPVQMMRSVIDAQSDASTLWREFENFDLIATIRMNPIFGAGYGNGYAEVIKLPEINYELERYAPHNSVLGLWAFCGLIGYTSITLLWIVGVYFALRAYHASKEPTYRVAAQVCVASVLIYMVQCWGDMGLGMRTGVFLVAPGIAVAGKLAAATGQWGKQKRKKTVQGGSTGAVHHAEQAA
jgi:O-antigen ligase